MLIHGVSTVLKKCWDVFIGKLTRYINNYFDPLNKENALCLCSLWEYNKEKSIILNISKLFYLIYKYVAPHLFILIWNKDNNNIWCVAGGCRRVAASSLLPAEVDMTFYCSVLTCGHGGHGPPHEVRQGGRGGSVQIPQWLSGSHKDNHRQWQSARSVLYKYVTTIVHFYIWFIIYHW